MYSKKQRIAALIGIILLMALYVFTLIAAIFNFDGTGNLLIACLFATIAIPILIWIYIWLYGVWTQKHTPASFDFMEGLKNEAESTAPFPQETDKNNKADTKS